MCNPKSTQILKHVSNNLIHKFLWIILSIWLCFIGISTPLRAVYDESANKITVAITQIVDHPSLDQARLGAIKALADHGYIESPNFKIIYQSAQGSTTIAHQIMQKFMAENPRLIIAISTPSAQVALKTLKNTQIPLVFSSITDPYAAGLLTIDETSSLITGCVDTPPLADIIKMIQDFLPNIKKIGVIYSTSEINSTKTIEDFKNLLKKQNIQCEEAIANSSGEISMAVTSLINKVDAIFIPADNVAFSALDAIIRITQNAKMPVFTSDPDAVRKGLLACIGYDQYSVGYTAGELASEILNGKYPKELPVKRPDKKSFLINELVLQNLKIIVPPSYQNKMTMIK